MPLFENVRYFFAPSCPAELRLPQSAILNANGATATDLASATHIITNTIDFEGKQNVKEEDIAIVTGVWVDRSVLFGKLQPTQFYSPDPSMLFSGIVACATDLSPSDLEVLSAGISALGGQWRPGLTREVTHLFAVVPGSEKYNTAMHYQADTKVKVLVPHWFDDSVRLGVRGLPTATYEWPDPQILKAGKGPNGPNESGEGRAQNKIPGDKKAMYRTALMSVAQEGQMGRAVQRDVWQGRRIVLSSDLELSEGRKQAVAAGIARAGGRHAGFER
ncbi:hypothetical protein EWM64_g739 [Hericium alpestre]|uniref:BRCT domain-containing protein n=1 Tax=Hericium alpestre TaxID=135208 RepID=A0A4Z0A861_9AGAM|nr:hypothetical protein EWM64_g739 [Hericium alpestre]